MQDFNARVYDAQTGRFNGIDPIEASIGDPTRVNPYLHGNNNPLSSPDPSGLISLNPANAVKKFFNNKSHYQDKALGTASLIVPCGGLYDSYLSSKQGKGNVVTDTLGAASCIPLAGGITARTGLKIARSGNKVKRTGSFGSDWTKDSNVSNMKPGTVKKQSYPNSCVAACGEILSKGKLTEKELIKRIGGSGVKGIDFTLLAKELGASWKAHGTILDNKSINFLKTKGEIGFRIFSGGTFHMVVGRPTTKGYIIFDPGIGSSYRVNNEWLTKYVDGVIYKGN